MKSVSSSLFHENFQAGAQLGHSVAAKPQTCCRTTVRLTGFGCIMLPANVP